MAAAGGGDVGRLMAIMQQMTLEPAPSPAPAGSAAVLLDFHFLQVRPWSSVSGALQYAANILGGKMALIVTKDSALVV